MNCPNCHQRFEKPPGGQIPYTCPHCRSNVLGVYCDLSLIGSGAMGDVYRALRPDMGRRTVAIKLPKAAEPRVCSRFEREIAASARLRHENIVCAFDRGEEEGRPYLVMEYVSGRVLSDMVDAEHPLSAQEAAKILRQVAAGLGHAAQQRIVNRDIKPDNVLITSEGAAKILDYGLALIAELDGSADRVTRNGTLLGTPGFLAPEQAIDPRGVNIEADVYSLGCTAHYILTRRPPFAGKDSFSILKQHATAPRPSVRAKRPDVDVALDELIQRMMSVAPEKRPSPRELVQQLDRLIPTLNAKRPSMAGPANGMLDTRCPNCQEVYHLRADMVGKLMQCRNRLCGQKFNIEPLLGETVLYSSLMAAPPVDEADYAYGTPADQMREQAPRDAEAADAEIAEAEAVDAEPVEAEPLDAEPVEAEAVEPESPEAAGTVFAGEPPPLAGGGYVPAEAEIAEAEIAEAEAVEPELAEPEMAEAEAVETDLAPPPLQTAAAVAIDAKPVDASGSALDTISATAVNIDTPLERPLVMIGASAVASPPGSPAVQQPVSPAWAAASGGWAPPAQPQTATLAPAPAAKSKKPARQPLTKTQQRQQRMRRISLACVAVMFLAGLGTWYFWPKPLTADERWAKAQELYHADSRQWTKAKKEFARFAEEFPEDERVAEVPYFQDMCDVGDLVYSDAFRGRRGEALAAAKSIFAKHRDNPAYEQYSADLFAALKQLIEHLLNEADVAEPTTRDNLAAASAKLASAREAHDLLKTVAESVKQEQTPSQVQALLAQIGQAEKTVQTEQSRLTLLDELKAAQTKEPLADIDSRYAKMEQLLASLGTLPDKQRQEIEELRREAWLSEKDRVRYVPRKEGDAPVAAGGNPAHNNDIFIVWEDRQAASSGPPIRRSEVLASLSRGVLYVFDAEGNFLWARRLGIDVNRLPLHTPATPISPPALIAVSTEDNTLYSLDAENDGRVLWRYKTGGEDIASPLTIVDVPGATRNDPHKQRGMLPTADGNINVLELVLGKQLGRFEVGHPLASTGGGYDAQNRLAYFPADSRRVFAINPLAIDNPAQPACKAVLFTEHASGALRSEPTIVDRGDPASPQSYMIMAEATELEKMKLRIFDISAAKLANPRSPPIQEAALAGWSWFSPLAAADRITLVTDAGDLGVFGVNLDNTEEALYRMVSDDSALLPVRDRFRSLAVDSDERYLWLMAGGELKKLRIDVLGQRVRTLWPSDTQPPRVTGIPLHEAQLDDRGDHLFLTLMSKDGGRFDFVAVESRAGQPVWQRQLGVKLDSDPLLVGEQVLLVDHTGRTVLLDPESSQNVYQPMSESSLPADAGRERTLIADELGRRYLMARLSDPRQIALAALDGAEGGLAWQTIDLPERLQGQPCVCGDYLVMPGADGILRRVALKPGAPPALDDQPHYWMPGNHKAPGPETAAIFAAGPRAILLAAARHEIRRLELVQQGTITLWQEGKVFESDAPLIGDVLVAGQRAWVADETGKVYAINVADPGKVLGTWTLGGRPTSSPFLRGETLLAVVEGRKLVAIAPEAGDGQPLWTTEPFKGRIRGQPLLDGDVLLVADEGRRVTAIKLSTGEPAWFVRLPARIGPVATAMPFGRDRILAPLADGTLTVVPRPAENKQVADAAKSSSSKQGE